jgi:hypothetical protein
MTMPDCEHFLSQVLSVPVQPNNDSLKHYRYECCAIDTTLVQLIFDSYHSIPTGLAILAL